MAHPGRIRKTRADGSRQAVTWGLERRYRRRQRELAARLQIPELAV